MILTQQSRQIERSGQIVDTAFKLKATGKAFKILSSGLYKNKIRAVVRELSCNAADAHVLAGRALEPFDVHVPNTLEPYFSVKDQGPGLSPEQINEVYTTYFESSKTHSNDYTGALGLGCKSPFAYTDSYTVTSVHQGIKSVYALYINEHDCPTVSRLGDSAAAAAGESDGLEVRMSVKNTDISSFREECKQVFQYFKVVPRIHGFPGFKITHPEVFFDGGYFRILKDTSSRSSVVIMGNIAYPINVDDFANRVNDQTPLLYRSLQGLRNNYANIEIDAPLGSVDFTAGREELSYDEKITIPYLIQTYERLIGDFCANIQKQVSDIKTEFEARCYFASIQNSGVNVLYKNNVFWQGKRIDSNVLTIKNIPEGLTIKNVSYWGDPKNMVRDVYNNPKDPKLLVDRVLEVRCSKALNFLVNDFKSGGERAAQVWVKSLYNTNINSQVIENTILLRSSDQTLIDGFIKNFPGVTVRPLSSVTTPVQANTSPRKKTQVKIIAGTDALERGFIRDCDQTQVDIAQGGVYVVSEFAYVKAKNSSGYSTNIGEMIDFINSTNPTTTTAPLTVYAVPKTLSLDFIKSEKWQHLEDLVVQRLTEKIDDYDLKFLESTGNIFVNQCRFSKVNDFYNTNNIIFENDVDFAPSIRVFAWTIQEIHRVRQQAQTIITLARIFKIKNSKNVVAKAITFNLDKLYQLVIDHYPMFDLIEGSSVSKPAMVDYIKMCDKFKYIQQPKTDRKV